MATEEAFFGGAKYLTTGSAVDVTATARLYVITPTANINATLPPASACAALAGGPVFCFVNLASAYSVTVKDSTGTTIATVAGEKAGIFTLETVAVDAGFWQGLILDITGTGA